MSDEMIGPGTHEDGASAALEGGRTEEAQVRAILALAAAVNRLAAAHESISIQMAER